MRITLAILAVSILNLQAYGMTSGGSEGVGGGDPLANEFILIARLIQKVHSESPVFESDLKASDLKSKIDVIEESLEGLNPILVFPEGKVIDCLGAPKLGCVTDGKIHMARQGWESATAYTKVQVTAMELFLSLGLKNRYLLAELVARNFPYEEMYSNTIRKPIKIPRGCIKLWEAQAIANRFLRERGHFEFSSPFPTTEREKAIVIAAMVDRLLPHMGKEFHMDRFSGYIALIHQIRNGPNEFYEFLTVSCDGNAEKLLVEREN